MKRLFTAFCFVICLYGKKTAAQFVDPDSYRTVRELITTKGYPLEEHTVQTSDGYLLSVQRIPYGKNSSTETEKKKVVLLLHGELGDAKTWFLNPPGQGLGYILPDNGYDVWIINHRGCDYSKKHVKYTTRDYRFWNFSFDEMALYDVPATIDYVLNATGEEQLYIIGYSRGNTVFFALLSESPEYNKKVKLAIALAPVAFIGNFKTAVRFLIPFAEGIALSINLVTQGEFVPHNRITKIITAKFCEVNDLEICENVLFAIGGQDRAQLNQTRIPIYAAQYPSSTSTKGLLHYAQLYRSKKFRKYDYGLVLNLKYYGQIKPPDYQVSRITAPMALFWSTNDKIADPKDVGIFRSLLKPSTLVFDYKVPDKYNHFDFILAKNAPNLIYGPVLQLLKKY